MLFPLTSDDLTSVLPPEQVVRTDWSAAAEVIAAPDAVAFLSEVGVPWCSGVFHLGSSLAPTSTPDRLVSERGSLPMVIDTPFGELGSLGGLQYVLVYVRRSDGVVFATSENSDEGYERIHSDVSSLSKLLLLIESKAPDPDLPYAEALPLYARAAAEIEAEISAVDPAPFADPDGFWTDFLDSFGGGIYPRKPR
ncbi:SUKH-4 family immunity protein [Streptacidiphilus jiangxiensis]|uniref:SUKH-4 immunity protein n=1 Tax=Streptacidiphilus jiangxiensis TaxID=235985 RepID=A0A1H7HZP3_STRJI|nr:SUKH-4 family immunity protein [Streptacidiphilus jiangxiensis]SEK55614.1 SUKH-4 immunity protein [Streptacidiphilus jiangxiensis]